MKASDKLDGNLDGNLDSVYANPKGEPLDPTENQNVASAEFAMLITMLTNKNKQGRQKTDAP